MRSSLACDLHYFLTIESDVPYSFSEGEVLSVRWCQTYIRGVYSELEARYLLSWWLHFSGCGARIRSRTQSNVAERAAQQQAERYEVFISDRTADCDPYFLCYQETKGQWYQALSKRLQKSYRGPTGEVDFYIFLRDMARKARLSIIFDPKVMYIATETRVHVANQEADDGKVLSETLEQLGLTYRLQGGVILIVSHDKTYSQYHSEREYDQDEDSVQ